MSNSLNSAHPVSLPASRAFDGTSEHYAPGQRFSKQEKGKGKAVDSIQSERKAGLSSYRIPKLPRMNAGSHSPPVS